MSTPRPYRSAVSRQACGIAAFIVLASDEGRSVTMMICLSMDVRGGMAWCGWCLSCRIARAHIQLESGPADSGVMRRRPGEIRS